MVLQSGTRLGPYEIISSIGAGGMGEVFKANDTRLDRSVAVKVLPAEFSQNAQLKLRFDREARAISLLEHPHICRLYDVGEFASTPYLVMELLDGESLADRLTRGPLPVADVLKYGSQIADALDRAHRGGIVHRDLKPANIMLTKSGAKLLDFGLAKSTAVTPIADPVPAGATEARPLTEQGTIVGTFQYMAPEQISGSEADPRTDIFALGTVLYEMVTGVRAFEGKTRTSLIAAIAGSEPRAITKIQPHAPPGLEHIIRKCLSKEPDERWQSAHDIAEELRWIADAGSQAGVATTLSLRRVQRERMAWALAAIGALAALAAAAGFVSRAPQPKPQYRFAIAAPPSAAFSPFDELGVAVSPDGRWLGFAAIGSDGRRSLWVRSFTEFDARELPETANASYPFWSPDSRFLGFFADGKLKKIDVSGGPPQNICDAASGRGASWGDDGTILLAPNVYSAIYRVSASGGTPVAVTKLDPKTEVTHRWPHLLPDGKSFLYVIRPKDNSGGRGPGRLMLGTLGEPGTRLLMETATNTVYLNGFLLFGREQRVMAQRFDLNEQEVTGEPFVVVAEKLAYWEAKNLLMFSAVASGVLAYLPETPPIADLRILSRQGRLLEIVAERALINYGARFSPDGGRVAFSQGDAATGREDIWIYDSARKRSSRFTFQPGAYWGITWAPDASRLYFASSPQSIGNLYQKPLTGSASFQPVVETNFWKLGGDISPDGKTLYYSEQTGETRYDLWRSTGGGKPELFHRTPFEEVDPRISPDGRWVAFTSNESGHPEVYVRPTAGAPGQWQVSSGGGSAARWRADGREIVYLTPSGKFFATPVQISPTFEPGDPKELFALGVPSDSLYTRFADMSPDGERILVVTPSTTVDETMRAVLNWTIEQPGPSGR